jgi:hypothetical protein
MNFPDKGMMLDSIKGSVATATLFLAYISLPLAGILPGLFVPLPAMYYSLKSGKAAGFAIVIAITVLLAIIANPMAMMLYLVQGGFISIALPQLLDKGWGGTRSIVSAVALSFIFLFLFVTIAWLLRGVDVHGMILKGIDSSISQTIALYEKSGLKEEELLILQQGMKQAGEVVGRIYPALVLIALGAIAGLNLQVLGRMAEKLNRPLSLAELSTFRNPDHLVWFVIVPGFALLVENSNVSTAALNVLAVTLSFYFVQGLAVALHLFDRFVIPRYIRIIFYFLLALQPYLAVAMAALGIFDLWGNFRAPRQQKNL